MAEAPRVVACDLGPGVRAFFTTRLGGVSSGRYASLNLGLGVADEEEAVLENRSRVSGLAGVPVAFATQIHGADVLEVTAEVATTAPSVGRADALLTRRPDVGLGVLVADCVPVLVAGSAPDGDVLATAHAGRKGLVAGVISAVVTAVRDAGATSVRAAVGPAICGRCYEVPAPMRAEVAATHPGAWSTTSWGTPALDLPAAVVSELRAAGAEVERVAVCTREDDRMFSYRRDGVTGRTAGVIATRRGVVADA